jgi:TRAP-type mannitol/chloroaromatic compound transport system substrate-binding protein
VDKLPEDLRLNLMSLADERFFSRTTEYQLKEAIALTKGRETMKVEVVQFPKAVEDRFAVASKEIMAKEAAKGPLAAKGAATVASIMKDLGYT